MQENNTRQKLQNIFVATQFKYTTGVSPNWDCKKINSLFQTRWDVHSEWHYIMWIPAQEKEHKPSCAPTIFMISQFGYHLNLKQVTLQFNIVTNSRQKTFTVFESPMSTVSSFMYCETSVPKEWHTEIYFGSISKPKTAISFEWLGIHIRTSRSDLYLQG